MRYYLWAQLFVQVQEVRGRDSDFSKANNSEAHGGAKSITMLTWRVDMILVHQKSSSLNFYIPLR